MEARVFIGVGSNIEPETQVPRALEALARELELVATSTFYWSAPEGRPEQPPFLNGVWEARSDREPRELKFEVLRGVERALGRRRSADRYAARCIDLDLLLQGDRVVDEPDLVLPDPEIATRAFLHVPLLELAPELAARFGPAPDAAALEAHPSLTRELRELLAAHAR